MNIHGLSPLARGTPSPRSGGAHAERFIPAGAGNTSKCSRMLSSCTVYPRWRGEHSSWPSIWKRSTGLSRWRGEHDYLPGGQKRGCGLSPLARGTHFGNRTGSTGHRFILAGAGNTQKHGAALVLRWFIPAGAGNTSGYFIEFINITVYPRWRGEHRIGRVDKTQPAGLSPLARGTRPSFSEVSA